MNTKKGDISAATVVGIVIAIVGFAIVLLFYSALKEGSGVNAQREVCRLSVLTRATEQSITGTSAIPIKCTTEKVCLTYGDKCKQFAGEENVRTVKLPGDDGKAAEVIEMESANAMFDCWSMIGEGKFDLFNQKAVQEFALNAAGSTCVICSRVAIAPDVEAKREMLRRVNINEYMKENNVPGSSLTYLQAFVGDKGINAYAKSKIEFDEKDSLKESDNLVVNEKILLERDGSEKAFVFMQIKAPEFKDSILNSLKLLGATAAGSTFVAPVTTFKTAAKLANPYVLAGTVVIAAGFAGYLYTNVLESQENFEQLVSAGYCGEIESTDKSENRFACSTVQGLDYDVGTINKLCGSIQGYP